MVRAILRTRWYARAERPSRLTASRSRRSNGGDETQWRRMSRAVMWAFAYTPGDRETAPAAGPAPAPRAIGCRRWILRRPEGSGRHTLPPAPRGGYLCGRAVARRPVSGTARPRGVRTAALPDIAEVAAGARVHGGGQHESRGIGEAMAARLSVTTSSSSGCRSTSSTLRRNSGSSSRNRTPPCARLTSPGRGVAPPPMRPASLTGVVGRTEGP